MREVGLVFVEVLALFLEGCWVERMYEGKTKVGVWDGECGLWHFSIGVQGIHHASGSPATRGETARTVV